jgi:CHAT domain-containing protein
VGGIEAVDTPRPKPRATPAPGRPAALHAGVPSEPSPWIGRRVWLAFAGANRAREALGDENEGMLTAEEVVTLDLRNADWVVLSACHSGATRAWTDAGALGMTHAFRLAGARTVIASRWSLEDESAREWMKALYAARARGVRRGSESAAAACRTVLAARRASGRTTHPFYWAAFSAAGD